MLSPNWNHLRIGPYLRGEADKREYHRLFTFPDYVTGWKRTWLLCSLLRLPATALSNGMQVDFKKRQLVVFENRVSANFEHHFDEVVGRNAELHAALREMTKAQYLPAPSTAPHIAIHVRMGDFAPTVSQDSLKRGFTNARLPLRWYMDMLQKLRARLGQQFPAIVYSDGSDRELSELLRFPVVKRSVSHAAVTDMLAIAQASVLISSGSGFSLWGCFLGGVPRICFPGQRLMTTFKKTLIDLEPEVDFNAAIPASFLNHVATGLV